MNARKRMVNLVITCIVFTATTSTVAAKQVGPDIAEILSRAAHEAAAGRFRQAAAMLDELADKYPDDYRVRLERAFYRLRAGDPEGAEADYRKALDISENSSEAMAGLADALAAQGRHDEALDIERRLLDLSPDEPEALNRYAYVLFLSEDYRTAQRFYKKALARRPGDPDAMLGLGWCALRLGRTAEARKRFRAVLKADPDNESAREGLQLVGPPNSFTPHAVLFADKFQEHPWRDFQFGAAAGVKGVLMDHVLAEITYRYLFLQGDISTTGQPATPRLQQHQVGVTAGWVEKAWGLAVHGAYVHYTADSVLKGEPGPDAGMVGLSARYTYWADFTLALTHSLYDDFGVSQADAGTVLPMFDWFDMIGGFELQYGDGRFWPSGLAAFRFHDRIGSITLGGTIGTRLRPVDLVRGTMYNTPDRLSGTAWVQADLVLGSDMILYASYEFTRLLSPLIGGDLVSTYGHGVAVGVSMTLY